MSRARALALAAILVACGPGGAGEPGGGTADRPAESVEPGAGAAGPGATAPESSPPAPQPAPPGSAPADSAGWTAGVVDLAPAGAGASRLTAVRAARHEPGFDRVVFELAGGRPGVHAEYVDAPVRQCGSGRAVSLPGEGWLEVRMTPAAAHADGASTIEDRGLASRLPAVREAVLTCDYEGVVTWVLAVVSPEPFRVRTLEAPPRVVVDVRHPHER